MKPKPLEMKAINRGLFESSRSLVRIRLLSFCLLAALGSRWSIAFGQQPASASAPLFDVNAKYVQGVGPGYWPTAGSGLTLNLAAGTAFCNASLVTYAGGTLTLAPNATNYVYLDPAAGCAPASNTTGFSPGQVPLAKVVTGSTSITTATDVRGWFVPQPVVTDSSGGAIASLKKLNGVRFAEQFALVAGSSTCGIAEAYADLPATGGMIVLGADCTITSTHTITLTNGKDLWLDMQGRRLTLLNGGLTFQPTPAFGSRVHIQNGTIIYSGSAATTWLKLVDMTNASLIRLTFNGDVVAGGVDLNIDNVEDSDFNHLYFISGDIELKLTTESNQNRFPNCQFNGAYGSGAATAAILITNQSSGNTFDDYLIQSNPALKPVQIYANAGTSAVSIMSTRFRGGWWENNGDTSTNTHLVDMKADAGKYIGNTMFQDNHFQMKGDGNAIYAWSGAGSFASLTLINNQAGWTVNPTNPIVGFPNGQDVFVIGDSEWITSFAAGFTRAIAGGGYAPGLRLAPLGGARQYQLFAGYPGEYDGYLQFWDLTAAASILSYHSNWWDTNGNSLNAGAGTLQAAAIQSGTTNPATTGQFRLASGDTLSFRNAANSGNVNGLSKDASDVVQVGGAAGVKTAGPLTVTTTSGAPLSVIGGDQGDGYSLFTLGTQGTHIRPDFYLVNTTDSISFLEMYGLTDSGGLEIDTVGGDLVLTTDTGNIILTPGTSGVVTARNFSTSVNVVSFSATPTFDASLGNTQQITLTGNVTSATLSNAKAGQALNFIICQDGSGSHTFVWPTTVLGGMTIGATASKCSAQSFIVNSAGTTAYATSPGVTNM